MASKLKDGDHILFIGDSITDCGRRVEHQPLGNGYVRFVRDLLLIREPRKRVAVSNRGISGNTAEDMRNRWADDVIEQRPDWLSIKIGINDCHRYHRDGAERQSPEHFEAIYDKLLRSTRRELPKAKLLLITPFYISLDNAEQSWRGLINKRLPAYIRVVERLSRRYRTRLLDLHKVFGRQLKHQHPDVYCPEPVHPNQTGHLLMAEAVYGALQ